MKDTHQGGTIHVNVNQKTIAAKPFDEDSDKAAFLKIHNIKMQIRMVDCFCLFAMTSKILLHV
jgi:hypothetical protein